MTAPIWLQMALIAALSGVLIWCAIEDIRRRQIPNSAVLSVIILFIIYSLFGFGDWKDGLLAGVLVFVPCFVLFQIGAFGGGDAKLMSAIALWMGTDTVLAFCLLTAIFGGILAAFFLYRHWKKTKNDSDEAIDGEEIEGDNIGTIELPYGVAIAGGALLIIVQMVRLGRI